MAKINRLFKSFFRLLLPVGVLILIAFAASSVWMVYEISQPPVSVPLVTPAKYGQISSRGAQVTDEKWTNRDGTPVRGWLLRGTPNSPAVVLLHKYGTDRSHLLNLGVKLNEATNFTVLMPDQRGHGEGPGVKHSTFGGCEGDDVANAIEYLRSMKTPEQIPLVGKEVGIYGLELGALSGIFAASNDPTVKALVLDSVPADSDSMLENAISQRFPFASSITAKVASLGAYPYYYQGCYRRATSCEMARLMRDRRVMLLGGIDAPRFQDSTSKTGKCFPATTTVDSKTDLSPSGYSMTSASIELSEAYDQRVIDFLRQALTMQ